MEKNNSSEAKYKTVSWEKVHELFDKHNFETAIKQAIIGNAVHSALVKNPKLLEQQSSRITHLVGEELKKMLDGEGGLHPAGSIPTSKYASSILKQIGPSVSEIQFEKFCSVFDEMKSNPNLNESNINSLVKEARISASLFRIIDGDDSLIIKFINENSDITVGLKQKLIAILEADQNPVLRKNLPASLAKYTKENNSPMDTPKVEPKRRFFLLRNF